MWVRVPPGAPVLSRDLEETVKAQREHINVLIAERDQARAQRDDAERRMRDMALELQRRDRTIAALRSHPVYP